MSSIVSKPWAMLSKVLLAGCGLLLSSSQVWAQASATSTTTNSPVFSGTNLTAYPPNIALGMGGPMMMLVASKDHTLFSPIYTDFEDVDGDGVLDHTYKPTFRYYGYFDPSKCYQYNASPGSPGGNQPAPMARFEPRESTQSGNYRCSREGRYWSGNFLNWATMTRIDVVRKLLYGGFRRDDTETDTTLEMAQLSQDAHSFVKYYAGADIGWFTPFTASTLSNQGLTICNRGSQNSDPTSTSTGAPNMRIAKGNYSLWATIATQEVCRWASEPGPTLFGDKAVAFFGQYGTDDEGRRIPSAQNHQSSLPVASDQRINGIGPEFDIRVQACPQDDTANGGRGSENCTAYVSADGRKVVYKPTGLLQKFGTSSSVSEAARAEFALLTGSYDHPLNGGMLRKNMGSLNDEVNLNNGRFCYRSSTVCPSITRPQGIISSFDNVRLVDTGAYDRRGREFILPQDLGDGMYPSWGNPISEMVAKALSYLAGHEVQTTAPSASAWPTDSTVGLPLPAGKDPLDNDSIDAANGRLTRSALYGNGICRAINLLAISSSVASFDSLDSFGGSEDDAYSKFNQYLNRSGARSSLAAWTDRVGALESINDTARSVGSVSGDFGTDCTSKDVGPGTVDAQGVFHGGLSELAGICPDAPSVKGAYLGAGATFYANTTAIRADDSLTPSTGGRVEQKNLPTYALRVKSYAASLAGGVARVEVPIPGAYNTETGKYNYSKRTVVITPESFWQHGDNAGLNVGAMLTFRAIGREAPYVRTNADGTTTADANFGGSGSYVVTWNDTQFGGDYDMDIVGFLRWKLVRISGATTTSTTQWALHVYTDILNVDAGDPGSHGFSIIGTDARAAGSSYAEDGRYITHSSTNLKNAAVRCSGYGNDTTDADFSKRYQDDLRCQFGDTRGDNGAQPWPASVGGGAGNVNFFNEAGTTQTTYSSTADTVFKVTATSQRTDVSLRDPLWYMAKYGSFDTKESFSAEWAARRSTMAAPDTISGLTNLNWDQEANDGSECRVSGSCADGEPDGYFLARRPELLEKRLTSLFERVANQSNTAVAASATQLISGSYKYIAKFTQSDDSRYGDLLAYRLKSNGDFESTETWSGALMLSAASARKLSSAKGGTDLRVVITNDRDTDGRNVGVPFNVTTTGTAVSTSLSSAYLSALTGVASNRVTASDAKNLIEYVRGSDAKEGSAFRARLADKVMGPIVSSSPWVQDPAMSARFVAGEFPSDIQSYLSFVTARKDRSKVVWVGSHDGMLHGFDALVGTPLLSYLPSPVVSRLQSLVAVGSASTSVPLVDGSAFTADLLPGPFTDATPWRTYLFGTLGRGGKAVFALDVSDTRSTAAATTTTAGAAADTTLNETNASRIFKWMFTEQDGSVQSGTKDGAYLGYGISSPVVHSASGQANQVVHLNNGKFGVLVPNGYGSTRGVAALFILFAEGPGTNGWVEGLHYKKWVPMATDSNNGMMGVTWVDLDNNGTADVVYATDLKGNVWKYDIRSADPVNWGSAFVSGGAAVPFFTAKGCASATVSGTATTGSDPATNCNDQPLYITGNPVATLPAFGGVMLSFGTGKAIEGGDFPGVTVRNRFISVWDKGRFQGDVVFPPAANTTGATLPELGGSFLEIVLARDTGGTNNVYRVNNRVEMTPVAPGAVEASFDPASHAGWFFNFPSSGEQLISSPTARRSFISFTSVRPLSDDDRATSCSTSPNGTLYAIDPSTGQAIRGLLSTTALTVVEGGTTKTLNVTSYGSNTSDQQVTTVGDRSTSTCGAGKIKARFLGEKTDEAGCVDAVNLRLQWREIPGMRTMQ
jgi:type IV pilus assembly protein PilY1